MSAFRRTLLLTVPALLVLLPATPGPAQPQGAPGGIVSHWWYPLGDPGATRRNTAPTASQTAKDIGIKWHTSKLKNSPTLLVGAIRTPAGASFQQVVGLDEDGREVMVLTHNGFIDTTIRIPQSNVLRLQLTGLFDTNATTIYPTSRPNVIGIGIEQTVQSNAQPQGLFVDAYGTPIYRLGITDAELTKVSGFSEPKNRIVSILPISLYKPDPNDRPVALGFVAQNQFVRNVEPGGRIDTLINSIRNYRLTRGTQFVEPRGIPFYAAVRLYETQPALYMTEAGSTGKAYELSLSPGRYASITPPIPVFSGTFQNQRTTTDVASLLYLNLADGTPSGIALDPTFSNGVEASRSQMSRMKLETSGGTNDAVGRLILQRRPAGSDSMPRLEFKGDGNAIASYVDGNAHGQLGWNSVFADVDGRAPGYPDVATRQFLVNNPGPEIITTAYPEGSGVNNRSWLSVFRWNQAHPLGVQQTFFYLTRQLVSGQVVAAGDIVADPDGREELLLTHGDTLFVLQMKSYADVDAFDNITEVDNAPFAYVDTFALDDAIVSVAIADLEGDGENDIVISTKSSTYAIGKVRPDPFTFATDPEPVYCSSDTISIAWSRNVGGEQEELQVLIIGDGPDKTLAPNAIIGDRAKFTGAQALLSPGDYRLVVRNKAFPSIADTSVSFTITGPSIGPLNFPNSLPYMPGTTIEDQVTLRCVDSFRVQRSVEGGDWEYLEDGEAEVKIVGSKGNISIPVSCPGFMKCGLGNRHRIAYRLVGQDTSITTGEREIVVELPRATLTITPDDTSATRRRTLQWDPLDFSCPDLDIDISADTGSTWRPLVDNVSAISGSVEIDIPDAYSDSLIFCIHCSKPTECVYGLTGLRIPAIAPGTNFVYPNPFDPDGRGAFGGTAEIVYYLDAPSQVSITIYDASRTVVRRLVESEMRTEGVIHGDTWDGRDSDGKKVANGTYICVIVIDSKKEIVLPIEIVKRQ